MCNGACLVIVFVVVSFNQAVAVIAQCFLVFLISYQVSGCSVPSFCPVERVVATADDYHVADINRTTEELKAIVRTFVSYTVVYRCTVAHAIEADAIGFVFFVEGITCVLQTNVLQYARVVFVIVATVFSATDFRATLTTFSIGVCTSADVDTTPCAVFFLFGSHHDGRVGCTFGIDFGSLLHEDVVHVVIIDSFNRYTRFDVQRSTFLYGICTAQFISIARFQRNVFRNRTAQRCTVGNSVVITTIVCCVVVATCGKKGHTGQKGH